MSRDAIELRNIRAKYHALGGAQWFMSVDVDGTLLEAKSATGEMTELARFNKHALPEEIDFATSALHMVGFLLGLVDRAIASANRAKAQGNNQQATSKTKNFAAEAAMKCEDPAFKVFMEEQHHLERPLTNERVAHKLRSVLGIRSRKELNDDAAAAERWRALKADFDMWKRRERR